MNDLVSIIIVNYNGEKLLDVCLRSLFSQKYKTFEVILIDNGSSDNSVAYVKKNYSKVQLVRNKKNLGFAEANNIGYRLAQGKYILFLNNDTEVERNFLVNLIKELQENIVGGLQSKILLMNDKSKLNVAGSYLTPTGFLYHHGYFQKDSNKYNNIKYIYSTLGASMIFKKDVLEKVEVNGELFDSRYFAYFEETDLCHRVWMAGYKILYCPESIIYHKVGATSVELDIEFVQFNSFKNRINSYLKNLGFINLLKILPVHFLTIYLGAFFYLLKFKYKMFFAINKAVLWNILNLRQTIIKRRYIQNNIRKIKDRKFFPYIIKNPPITYYYYLFTGLEKYNFKLLK